MKTKKMEVIVGQEIYLKKKEIVYKQLYIYFMESVRFVFSLRDTSTCIVI